MQVRSTIPTVLRTIALFSVLFFAGVRWHGTEAGVPPPPPALVIAEPPAGKLYEGVFPGSHDGMGGDITSVDLADFVRATGKAPTWVYFCHNWYQGKAFPESKASAIRANGSVPYIRLMLLSQPWIPCPEPVYKLENIIRGRFDPELRQWMRDAKRFGSPILAEYGVEANGFWFPWNGLWNREGGTYEDGVERFRKAYRHIIGLAREEGAYNVRWVFHADPWDEPLDEWNHFEHYYPGDEWIDWVGLSVYGRQAPSDEYYPSFRQQMDKAYLRLTNLTSKPVIVCEFGTIEDRGQAEWADKALADVLGGRWPKVIGFSWWNATFFNDRDNPRGHSDMRVQGNAKLSAVFRSRVGNNPRVLSLPVTALRAGFPARR